MATYVYDGDGRRIKKVAGGETRWTFYDPAGRAVWEYKQGAAYPWDTFVFHFNGKLTAVNSVADGLLWTHLDHLGTPRVKTDATGKVAIRLGQPDRDWYYPFGEQINAPVDGVRKRFTGQERDPESGLDYFGARYYSSALGRFLTPDPLRASARLRDPQTWNRFVYALNNPLRFSDPDGMEVPESCTKDAQCQIVIRVNVIYNREEQFTEKEKEAIEKQFLDRARSDFMNSNIKLEFSYSEGQVKKVGKGKYAVDGASPDALNVVVSPVTPKLTAAGVSFVQGDGSAIVIIAPKLPQAVAMNTPVATNTLEHEIGHHLLGHVNQAKGIAAYASGEFATDLKVFSQSLGMSIQSFREGTGSKPYSAPANPTKNQPPNN